MSKYKYIIKTVNGNRYETESDDNIDFIYSTTGWFSIDESPGKTVFFNIRNVVSITAILIDDDG